MSRIQKIIYEIKTFFKAQPIEESSELVKADNIKMLYLVNISMLFLSFFLDVYVMGRGTEKILDGVYGAFSLLSIAVILFTRFVVEKNKKWIPFMIVLFYAMIDTYMLTVVVYYQRYDPATSLYVFMSLAFCFLVKPIYLILLQVATCVLFATASMLYKPYAVAEIDAINAAMMLVISLILGCTVLRFRMSSIQKLEQREQALAITQSYETIMEETQTAVIVYDIQTGQPCYANHKFKEIYEIADVTSEIDKESRLYKERVCGFEKIDIDSLEVGTTLENTEYEEQTDRYYQIKGKIIEWRGCQSYIEYITDITDSYKFNEQLQIAHEELKKKYQEEMLYRENVDPEDLIASSRINLTQGYIEEMRIGKEDGFEKEFRYALGFASRIAAFTSEIWMTDEQNVRMSPENLKARFAEGQSYFSEEFLAELKNGHHVWIKSDVNLVERPETAELIAFSYSRDVTRERVLTASLQKIMSFEYDEIYTIDSINGWVTAVAKGHFSMSNHIQEGTYQEELENLKARCEDKETWEKFAKEISLENINRHLAEAPVFEKEIPLMSKNGSPRLKQLRFMYLNEEIGDMLLTITDIEEVVREEKEKKEKLETALQIAEEASATKTSFLARMSHEIRTPMNAIIGLTSMVKEDATNLELVQDCTEKLDSASKYLLALLNDILDMSRIESGNVELQRVPFQMSQVWKSINTLAKAQAVPARIEYLFEENQRQTDTYMGDATRFQQIMVNLINNAMKFTAADGRVKVSLKEEERKNGRAKFCIQVEDNGIGISEDFLPNVFQVFTQEHDGNTSSYGGSGLGLSIAKNYAKMMDGDITVESKMGVGTTFTVVVYFDLAEEGLQIQENPEILEGELASFEGKRALLVEDHPLNTMVATRLLHKKGMIVDHVENGKQAVELYGNSEPNQYDVVLMDIRMPVMDGIEATRQIRALRREDARTVPIIAMTANAYDEDRRKTKEAGMNAHLAKPIDPQLLFETLGEYLKAE